MDDLQRLVSTFRALALVGTLTALAITATTATTANAAPFIPATASTAKSREASDYLLHGKPGAALKLYGVDPAALLLPKIKLAANLKGSKPGDRAVVAWAFARVGHYAEARAALRGCSALPCVMAAVRVEQLSGSRKTLVKLLTTALKARPKDVVLRVELGRALRQIGQKHAARRMLDPLADLYQDGQIKRIDELVAVAESLAFNGYFKDANTVMAEASEGATGDAERKLVEAAWGQLFLGKYNFRDADTSFEKALKIDPYHPESTVAMARIDLDSDNDVKKARERLDKLLKRQPRHVGALAMRAEVALRDEEPSAAQVFVQKALAIQPDSREALHVLAAVALTQDDTKTFKHAEKSALAADAFDGELYVKTAHYLELGHRYPEVLALLQKALKKDPELWGAQAQLGVAYSRFADDKRAREHLEAAFGNDPYNVRTANILNVLYDGVLKHMHVLKGEHVDLRTHRRTRKALERTVLPFLQHSYDNLAGRYKMQAPKPLQVEIFPTTEQFSVRTVGLPRLGAHAVCFGHLITSRSPAERPFNWKMVLHHEMSHVFHIRATGGRVPRWLTEGVAMMESAWLDPTWHIISERRAYDRLMAGDLAKIDSFNLAFSQARSMRGIVDAYYQAMLLVRFLADKWGFDKLRQLVAGHGKGATTSKLIAKIYGMPSGKLDAAFAAWLGEHLARFKNDFRPSIETIKKHLGSDWQGTDVATVALGEAIALLDKGQLKDAYRALRTGAYEAKKPGAGTEGVPPTPLPPTDAPDKLNPATTQQMCAVQYTLMDIELSGGGRKQAAAIAKHLVAVPNGRCDGVVQRLLLARVAKDAGDEKAMVGHFERALTLDPRDASVLSMWLKATAKTDTARQRELARKIIELDPNDVGAPVLLAKLAWAALAAEKGIPQLADKPDDEPESSATTANASPKPLRLRTAPGREPLVRAAKPAARSPSAAQPVAKAVKLDDKVRGGWQKDLERAAQRLEEVVPTRLASVLFEARVAVVQGQLKAALPIYREAARRAKTARTRQMSWCELAWVAQKAAAKDDAAEATRRCAAARAEN